MDRAILFSAPMVRALLAGTKTQTRRVLKPQPGDDGKYPDLKSCYRAHRIMRGDRLWVREAWKAHSTFEGVKPRDIPPSKIFYLADPGYSPSGSRGRPSMFMPRWASRLTLTVTDVRVQRLQDISEEDARAEGAEHNGPCDHSRQSCADIGCFGPNSYRGGFAEVWWEINGVASWDANPWVAAYSFTVERLNIDMPRPA